MRGPFAIIILTHNFKGSRVLGIHKGGLKPSWKTLQYLKQSKNLQFFLKYEWFYMAKNQRKKRYWIDLRPLAFPRNSIRRYRSNLLYIRFTSPKWYSTLFFGYKTDKNSLSSSKKKIPSVRRGYIPHRFGLSIMNWVRSFSEKRESRGVIEIK